MNETQKTKDYLTTTQAAKLLSVSPDTVLKWVKAGKVKSYRTLGGHFRIPLAELGALPQTSVKAATAEKPSHPVAHQYCWEFHAGDGEITPECRECVTFRSRARRCYELKDLPEGMGCLNVMCDTDCSQCGYYQLVSGQGINVLILSEGKRMLTNSDQLDDSDDLQIRFATNEYEASTMIEEFRPDYVVVDCAIGKLRTASVCNSLFGDKRIPVARIVLSSRTKNIKDYCDRDVFGWIKKPFEVMQLLKCIRGVPETESVK